MTRDTYDIHTDVRYAPLEKIDDIEGKPTAELHPRQGMVVPTGDA